MAASVVDQYTRRIASQSHSDGEMTRSERAGARLAEPPSSPALWADDDEGKKRIELLTNLVRIFIGPMMAITALGSLTQVFAYAMPVFLVCLGLWLTTRRVLANGGVWPQLGAILLVVVCVAMVVLTALVWRAVVQGVDPDTADKNSVIGLGVVLTLWTAPFIAITAALFKAGKRS